MERAEGLIAVEEQATNAHPLTMESQRADLGIKTGGYGSNWFTGKGGFKAPLRLRIISLKAC